MEQYYIYLTTNLINGKKYVGQHYGRLDDGYLGSGNVFKKALEKYGRQNFQKEILEVCDNFEELNIAEERWIKKLNAVKDPMYYNVASGGFNSNPCAGLSKEAEWERKRKISEANKGNKNYFYGKHLYGKNNPRFGTRHSKEAKEKMRLAKIGGKAPTAKAVAIYDLEGKFIRSFETQRELKIFLGLSPNGSTDTLKKYIRDNKPYHGYIIKYIELEPVSTIL